MISDQRNKPFASVVIRCYNEEKHIGRLLHGISQQTIKDIEIIIVDSGSTDGTLAIASRFPLKIVTVKPEDFSFGRSLNLGCTAATSDFIVIASAHVYPVYRDWIEQLLTPFQDSSVGLVYGKQRGGETTKFAEHQLFERWFPDKSNPNRILLKIIRFAITPTLRSAGCCGNNFYITRKLPDLKTWSGPIAF